MAVQSLAFEGDFFLTLSERHLTPEFTAYLYGLTYKSQMFQLLTASMIVDVD